VKRNVINIGIIGFGTVGSGTAQILVHNQSELEDRLGFPLRLKKIADLDITRDRGVNIPPGIMTNKVSEVLEDPEIHIVVELIGGIHPAKEMIIDALKGGKHVVTANKALLATEGADIFRTVDDTGTELGFEAAVAGGIPIIKVVKESLAGNKFFSVAGIMNGTSNYILTKMTEERMDFSQALKDAQRLGYAEADPTFDVEGVDSAHKLAILASLAFGIPLSFDKIFTEGITRITPLDIEYAREFGCKIKLLAVTRHTEEGVELRVHPTMISQHEIISHVDGAYNAILIEGDAVGSALFYGQGAGSLPTGSAVVSDIVDIARNIVSGTVRRVPVLGVTKEAPLTIKEIGDLVSRYYFRFSVYDKPGVLSKISGILGNHNISIQSVLQKGRKKEKAVPLVILTHESRERDVVSALNEIDSLSVVAGPSVFIRIEGSDE
jgi:homoserine dehydrogenase